MDILKIESTKDTPTVILNPITNVFEISGKSHPENIREFFKPIFEWLDNYYTEVKGKKDTKIEFNLNYIYVNSSSFKYLIVLIKKLKEFYESGVYVEFVWHYEQDDDDMKESGFELFEMSEINIPFRYASYIDDDNE
ncbi:MAG TPA: nuclear pore complex subunit [Bacteroidales bacterium]|nr:MAG: hypothetical protein A2W98_07990 [Bacteroidetes bacterium GWF2_33_38]OFY88363.1 MAG: hypothetical protein A2236_02240 [Bacteroidetes bacterium RIFOXYA2_FULL_33_7]HBF87341.1 nuclear pore complex subunit [Bacteroidales bacterium]